MEKKVKTPQQEHEEKILWAKWVLGVAIFALVTSGILHVFEFFMQPQPQSQKTAKQANGSSPTPTPIMISTTNWKTYTNSLAELSFKYPPPWTVKEVHEKSNRVIDNPKEINTAIFTGPEGKITLQWGPMGFGGGCDIQYHTEITVGGEKEDICHLVNSQGLLTWRGISNNDKDNLAQMRIESPNTKYNEAVMNKVIETLVLLKSLSPAEKIKIDTWITKNNLNQFGDPKDTVYTGGTPLFNEATSQTIDKYQYILSKHLDRPWNK